MVDRGEMHSKEDKNGEEERQKKKKGDFRFLWTWEFPT